MGYIIAIDGPAGSGKGTLAKKLAEKINFITLDTGALYRCVTLEVIKNNINLSEIDRIIEIIKKMNIKFEKNDIREEVYLNNEIVTDKIRSKEVNNLVSNISTIKEVRNELVNLQRKIADDNNIIMEGRDIGTVVFPNANLKIYLDANLEERAKRRYKENIDKGIKITYEEVLDSVKNRDKIDSEREVSPLKKAEDAIIVDSTNMSIEEVVKKVEDLYKNNI